MNMIHSVQKETKDIRQLSCYSFARNQLNHHRSAKDNRNLLLESENRKETRIRTNHRFENLTKKHYKSSNEGNFEYSGSHAITRDLTYSKKLLVFPVHRGAIVILSYSLNSRFRWPARYLIDLRIKVRTK